MALPWWQHHKHCLVYYYIISIIIITGAVSAIAELLVHLLNSRCLGAGMIAAEVSCSSSLVVGLSSSDNAPYNMFPPTITRRDFRKHAYQCQPSMMLIIVLFNAVEEKSLELRLEVDSSDWLLLISGGSRFHASGADMAKQPRPKSSDHVLPVLYVIVFFFLVCCVTMWMWWHLSRHDS